MTALLYLLTAAPLALILIPVIEYLVDAKKLRRFPSPGIAGFSDLWALRYHWTNSRYQAVHDAHQRLGSIVRIQPHHVSFTDPRALKDIYGHGSSIMKSPYYDNIAGDYHDVANATDRSEHSRKRRLMSHVFSQKHILTMEEVINTVLGNLVQALDKRLTQDLDIRYWFNLFTFDAISSLAFSQPFNFLDTGNDLTFGRRSDGSTYPMNLVGTFHNATSYAAFFGHARPGLAAFIKHCFILAQAHGAKALRDFGAMCEYKTDMRATAGKGDRFDFFSKLEEVPKGQAEPMPFGEQVAEAGIMLNAGSDTTASGLTNTLFLLAKHPETLAKLRQELEEVMTPESITPDFNMLMASPYLRACLDESLRLRPPVAIGLPRVTPKEGSTICGHFIPGGVTVSVPILELNRHPDLFPRPDEFDPSRWLDEKQLPNLKEYVQPFSIGGRACIGRNLAMIELTKVVATMVNRYDVELLQDDLALVERFNMNPGPCHLRLTRRQRIVEV
jgi:cytochrome P450